MKNNSKLFIIFIIIVICTNGFSCLAWNTTISGWIMKITSTLLAIYFLIKKKFVLPVSSNLKKAVLFFMFLPFISMIPAYIYHGQNPIGSFLASEYNLWYTFFFLLYSLNVDDKQLIKLCCYFGLFWCCVEIVQQLSYPNVWFALRTEADERGLEIRNGIYRYDMVGREFGLIMLFYSFTQFLIKVKVKYVLGVLLGLVGVYLLAARQTMAAVLVCLFYALYKMKKLGIVGIVVISLVFIIIYINAETLFGEFVEKAANDLDSDDYVRFLAYDFYGITYNNGNFFKILLGNGDPYKGSSYFTEIDYLQDNLSLWRADIGIVGVFSVYGAVYIIAICYFIFVCLNKWKYIDLYLKMYFLYVLLTSIMLWHFCHLEREVVVMSILCYLIDLSIRKNKNLEGMKRVKYNNILK